MIYKGEKVHIECKRTELTVPKFVLCACDIQVYGICLMAGYF